MLALCLPHQRIDQFTVISNVCEVLSLSTLVTHLSSNVLTNGTLLLKAIVQREVKQNENLNVSKELGASILIYIQRQLININVSFDVCYQINYQISEG